MIVPALTAAMLLAGAQENPGGVLPAVPVPPAAPGASDQEVRVPAAPAVAPEPDPPAAPAEAQPTEPAAPAPSPGMDQGDIVVTGRPRIPGDPLEKVNEKSFATIQKVDKAFVGPVALAYEHRVPGPIRSGLRNFLSNLKEPDVFLNFLLQLKPGKAAETFGRFAINSTIGGAGLFDVAKRHPFKLPRRKNGFAYSLGYYGVKPGPFLYLPLVGATTLRDVLGDGLDQLVLPLSVGGVFNQLAYEVPTGALSGLDQRAEFDEQLHKLRDGPDPYAASREFYLKGRQAEIDHLRGRHGATDSPAPGLTNPAIEPFTPPPAPPATAPAAAPSPAPGEKPAATTAPDVPTQPDRVTGGGSANEPAP